MKIHQPREVALVSKTHIFEFEFVAFEWGRCGCKEIITVAVPCLAVVAIEWGRCGCKEIITVAVPCLAVTMTGGTIGGGIRCPY